MSLYIRVPRTRILLGEPHNELSDLDDDAWAAWPLAPRAIVPLARNQFAVPGEQRIGRDDTGNFGQKSAPEDLALHRQPSPLIVRETESLPEKPSPEDSDLLAQIVDGQLLHTLDPASDGHH